MQIRLFLKGVLFKKRCLKTKPLTVVMLKIVRWLQGAHKHCVCVIHLHTSSGNWILGLTRAVSSMHIKLQVVFQNMKNTFF